VLEAIHSGLGFARTAFVMRDPASGLFRTRAAFGDPRPAFSFPSTGASHLFVAALAHATDLHIADVSTKKCVPHCRPGSSATLPWRKVLSCCRLR